MASRVSRHFLSSSLRVSARSARPTSVNGTLQSFRAGSLRKMSSTAEPKKSSDMPWIIGSALVFGPAFLYMLSPSARKTAPHKPHDKHESKSHASMPMKDDEGTVADVSESVQKGEATDAPQSSSAEPEPAKEEAAPPETKTEPEPEPAAESHDEPQEAPKSEEKVDEKEKSQESSS